MVIAVLLIVALLKTAISTQEKFITVPESQVAAHLITQLRGDVHHATEVVIVRSHDVTVKDPVFRAFVDTLSATIEALAPEIVQPESLLTYYRVGARALMSADGHATVLVFHMAGSREAAEEHVQTLQTAVRGVRAPVGFEVLQAGEASLDFAMAQQAQHELLRSEGISIVLATLVLIVVFGGLVAALCPIAVAVVSSLIALGVAVLIGQVVVLSFFIVNITTVLGLAVGIDYSLLILQRYREERAAGRAQADAIAQLVPTACQTVVYSGMTLVVALLGMFLVPFLTFLSVGLGAILVTVTAMLAALTLLPALLSLFGDRLGQGRTLLTRPGQAASPRLETGGFWNTVTRVVTVRPWLSILVGGGLLLIASLPIVEMRLGFNGLQTFPKTLEVSKAFAIIHRDFTVGYLQPVDIVLQGEIAAPEVWQGLSAFLTLLRQDHAKVFLEVDPLEALEQNEAKGLAVLSVPMQGDIDSIETRQALARLRHTYIPHAFATAPVTVFVGGSAASKEDFARLAARAAPRVILFVLGLSFVLLLLVFRSVVVPIKAVVLNLLSVGAAYGCLVAVFQKGWGHAVLGFQHTATIEPWLPLFLFAVLFGLSMDYHVFLLSRIRERYDETQDNRHAVAFGLRTTGKLITGAALIMVVVFSGFASGELVEFQQMGFGLAIAVLLDATLVRSVLLPATMVVLGRLNWYLPFSLRWLPEVHRRRPTDPVPGGSA
jgi:RND superfamily putative drug exporter